MDEERVQEFRQEAMIEEVDGSFYLTLHGSRCADRWGHWLKAPFNPHVVNGYDDGDPHLLA